MHLDCVLELLVEVVASLEGGVEVVVHPIVEDPLFNSKQFRIVVCEQNYAT